MFEHPNLIPLTVVVAFGIFVLKEILEAWRRWRANLRKLHALKALLSAECERNYWTIKWLMDKMPEIRNALDNERIISIETTSSGKQRLQFRSKSTGGTGSSPIPKSHFSTLDKYLFEVASLDARLFGKMETTLASAAELNHLCSSLVEMVGERPPMLRSWTEYAERTLVNVEADIGALYRYCTGVALTKWRLR